MNSSELARLMLYWEDQKRGADKTKARIKEAVLELGHTVDTGNVRASYSAGRKKYGYQEAADGHPLVVTADIATYTIVVPETVKIDWRSICDHVGIEIGDVPFTQSDPSVTVKLLS